MNPLKLNESCISEACQNSLERSHQGSVGKGGNQNETTRAGQTGLKGPE